MGNFLFSDAAHSLNLRMNKKKQPNAENKPRGKYSDKLKVKGSFLDLMKAAAKDANTKPPKKNGKPKP